MTLPTPARQNLEARAVTGILAARLPLIAAIAIAGIAGLIAIRRRKNRRR